MSAIRPESPKEHSLGGPGRTEGTLAQIAGEALMSEEGFQNLAGLPAYPTLSHSKLTSFSVFNAFCKTLACRPHHFNLLGLLPSATLSS